MSKVLYARVSDEAHAYLSDLADQSGLTIAHVTDGIVCEAMRRGWRVDPKPSLILEDIRDGRQDFSR